VVELPQFESLGGLSVIFETSKVKVKMDGQFKGVKCNFPKKKMKLVEVCVYIE
jgi:hypothetical protein